MKAHLLLFALLGGCPSSPKQETESGDTQPVDTADLPLSGSLSLTPLSPTEAWAQVDLPEEGTLVCGAIQVPTPAGSTAVYVPGFAPSSQGTCFAWSATARTPSASVTLPGATSPGTVLFDAAHGEQAGNADWVVDDDMPYPSPSDPSSAESWDGGISSFGFALHEAGYTIRSQSTDFDAGDLAGIQVLVFPEPNNSLSSSEISAVAAFVQAGGGLVLMSNHHDSDRDYDNVDATDVVGGLLDALGTGITQAASGWDVSTESNTTPSGALDGDPILRGRHGNVYGVTFFDASGFEVTGMPGSRKVISMPGQTENPVQTRVAAGFSGAGRVVAIPDSAAADDGTGEPGDELLDGWSESDNAIFFLNATDWAANVR